MSATTRPDSRATSFKTARIRNLLVAILVPLALAGLYFAALGGANERTGTLPALIVNNDEIATQANPDGTETQVTAGRLLVSWFTNTDNVDRFDWQLASEDTAQDAIASGDAYVVLTIPEDFSASIVSLSGGDPQAAKINITTSQSKDWLTGEVSQDVFDGLTAQFGQTVTNMIAVGLVDGLNDSASGLQEAADGATQLADGIGQLDDGFSQFLDGSTQLAEGTGEAYDGAVQFSDGVGTFSDGIGEYSSGVSTYVHGVNGYVDGVSQFSSGVDDYVGGVDEFAGGVQELSSGLDQLDGGSDDLQYAAGELQGMADQLGEYSPQISGLADVLDELAPILGGLSDFDPAELTAYCDELEAVDPVTAASCRDAVDELIAAVDTSGIDLGALESGLSNAADQLGSLADAGDGLGQLADGIIQYTDGVGQLADGSGQLSDGAGQLIDAGGQLTDASGALIDGGEQLTNGGSQLLDGGSQLEDGASQLGDGASALADGLSQLRDGQQELNEGGEELGDGIGELEDGARTMAQGLQDGADQAENAISDPEAFAEILAEPVVAETVAKHDPTFGGVLGAIGLAIGVWLAALITALRRRTVTEDILESSASSATIFLAGARKLTIPVGIVAIVLAIVPHVFLGAPWSGFLGSIAFAVLATGCIAALHLLFATLFRRRTAAVVSIALLLLQLILLPGFIPLEFSASWAQTLSGLMPISQIVSGLQVIYAGGAPGAVFASIAGLVLIGTAALAITAVALQRKRRVILTT